VAAPSCRQLRVNAISDATRIQTCSAGAAVPNAESAAMVNAGDAPQGLFAPLNFLSFHLLINARNSMLARKL
jgi:methyl coenzyme M reductase beta subunit